jgi:hypothetical protein
VLDAVLLFSHALSLALLVALGTVALSTYGRNRNLVEGLTG